MSVNRTLHFSDAFAIGCGTIAVDLSRSKVLLIRRIKTGEHFLPKGRKNLYESLEQAALRETQEETGIKVELLPVDISTRATTLPSWGCKGRPRTVVEPIAVSQRATNSILQIIFWFVAKGDSTTLKEDCKLQDNEDYDSVWADWEDVASLTCFEDDLRIAQAAIEAAKKK